MSTSQGIVTVTEGKTVVLAVHKPDERQAVTDLLQEMNMEVHHAETAQDAIYLLEDFMCDFLVMDIQMPDMHAWRMLGTLRESVDISALPTIVIMDEKEIVSLANVTSVVRPVSMAKLRQIIDSLFTV